MPKAKIQLRSLVLHRSLSWSIGSNARVKTAIDFWQPLRILLKYFFLVRVPRMLVSESRLSEANRRFCVSRSICII